MSVLLDVVSVLLALLLFAAIGGLFGFAFFIFWMEGDE